MWLMCSVNHRLPGQHQRRNTPFDKQAKKNLRWAPHFRYFIFTAIREAEVQKVRSELTAVLSLQQGDDELSCHKIDFTRVSDTLPDIVMITWNFFQTVNDGCKLELKKDGKRFPPLDAKNLHHWFKDPGYPFREEKKIEPEADSFTVPAVHMEVPMVGLSHQTPAPLISEGASSPRDAYSERASLAEQGVGASPSSAIRNQLDRVLTLLGSPDRFRLDVRPARPQVPAGELRDVRSRENAIGYFAKDIKVWREMKLPACNAAISFWHLNGQKYQLDDPMKSRIFRLCAALLWGVADATGGALFARYQHPGVFEGDIRCLMANCGGYSNVRTKDCSCADEIKWVTERATELRINLVLSIKQHTGPQVMQRDAEPTCSGFRIPEHRLLAPFLDSNPQVHLVLVHENSRSRWFVVSEDNRCQARDSALSVTPQLIVSHPIAPGSRVKRTLTYGTPQVIGQERRSGQRSDSVGEQKTTSSTSKKRRVSAQGSASSPHAAPGTDSPLLATTTPTLAPRL
jgi:hypothetical protein